MHLNDDRPDPPTPPWGTPEHWVGTVFARVVFLESCEIYKGECRDVHHAKDIARDRIQEMLKEKYPDMDIDHIVVDHVERNA